MESSGDLQMDGINSEVYDIFHPTPVSLKDLSTIAVSLGIWRSEVMKYRSSDDMLEKFDPTSQNISLETVLPGLPSVIHAMIDKYVTKLGFSLGHWLRSHQNRVFHFHYGHRNRVLKCFEDFVCDYDGTIHYVRTAERMMHCDQFDVQQKFIIACTYFFEDDIRRLWPLVSSNIDLKGIHFHNSPQLYYWICCLKNELDKMPDSHWDNRSDVDGVMLENTMAHNRPSVEYFWNRIPTEKRKRKAYILHRSDVQSFARYILPKLDDQQLDEFVNVDEDGFKMMHNLHRIAGYNREFILSIWMQIRNIMDESVFTNEIIIILLFENGDSITSFGRSYCDDEDGCMRRNWLNLCCEIWNNAPERLKRSAVKEITSDDRWFQDLWGQRYSIPPDPKEYIFLPTFLSYATFDERRTFCANSWRHLIQGTRCQDFKKIINWCFENEDEITQFKENIMSNCRDFLGVCETFLTTVCFDELNEFVSLVRPDAQAARNFKQQFLQSIFLGERRNFYQVLIWNPRQLSEFINDVYNDTDLSWEFKNQLISSPVVVENLPRYALMAHIKKFKEFIDAFVSNEETALQIKTSIIDYLKQNPSHKSWVSKPSFTALLSWCLENDEEVTEFKRNYLGCDA